MTAGSNLHAAGGEHAVDELAHVTHACRHDRHDLGRRTRQFPERALLEHREVATDKRDRGAELVGGELQELRFLTLQLRHPLGVRLEPVELRRLETLCALLGRVALPHQRG